MNHPVETFAFRFTQGGRTLAYTGDTGETEAVRRLPRGRTFVSEAAFIEGPGLPPDMHLTARQAARYANRADVGNLILTHLVPWNRPTNPGRGSGLLRCARPRDRGTGNRPLVIAWRRPWRTCV